MKKDLQFVLGDEKSSLNAIYQRLDFAWRYFGAVLGCFLFGLGCVIVCFVVVPFIMLYSKNKHLRTDRVRSVIHYTFRLFLSYLEMMNILKIKTDNLILLQDV